MTEQEEKEIAKQVTKKLLDWKPMIDGVEVNAGDRIWVKEFSYSAGIEVLAPTHFVLVK